MLVFLGVVNFGDFFGDNFGDKFGDITSIVIWAGVLMESIRDGYMILIDY